ncbi:MULTISPECIES: TRAP transporter large permease subunit [Rhizobium/Agrobacterium group]|jgi:tripartite ATP-independent transporter DctM subunit|uniref:TRAP transporter large permease n=1 Tax=Rhizobium/Agrobacterium group TaxID=227290 RepID=UPI000715159C|nr:MULTISPECIES: TRAP transporter large permease subunit [Rhizobium/Agrobacterium group]KQQ34449.1 C4-dicarboxylate ABC transporter [Rhizobium sp. Leaf306]MBD8662120.1 TRAP transporter large permease subunit [Rhizobium sp. CFBP 8752]MBP2462243.1 tripartite ATP-independent transporter DctM subunit [Rhizobium sp. PvP014]MBP2529638.1 tripartite ATP-independent transporter DctM subunit [Rhizobium sp. PvP099]NSY17061.1 TRAP transporter large permease subunit [Neorhizobium sp. AL 9.2.2]
MFEYGVMPPAMFLGMIIFMLYGFPVAFSLSAVGLFFGFLGIYTGHFEYAFMQALPLRIFGIVSNDLLLAIPFFTFMGAILERCGLAEDLLEGTGKLFGAIPGGLAYAVIIVGAILGAITGTVAASVITMGVISLPIMLKYGYNPRLATGVIAASGTITQVIPPSLVLIVLADQLGRSVGDMYLGAIGPSILQVVIFLLFILFTSIVRPQDVPALPPEARGELNAALVLRVLWGMVPSVVLIFLVLGTLFMGLATPTEAGALGVVGAMALAAMHRRLTWDLVKQAMHSTMTITSMVVFILVGATCFSLVFQGMNGGLWIEFLLSHIPGGALGFLIFVNIFIFFLAFFLDFFEIAFIVLPMLAPVATALGIDLIWFGVLLCVNMQTSFMHPPFGFALFYLRSIAPKTVKTKDIYLGAIPWLGMQLILVAIIIFWPESVTYWLDKAPDVDLNTIKIEIPGFGNDSGNNQMPNFGLPPMDGAPGQGGGAQPAPGLPGMPNFGEPPKINP